MNQKHWIALAALVLTAGCATESPRPAAPLATAVKQDPQDLSGIWWSTKAVPVLTASGGAAVPLRETARELQRQKSEEIRMITDPQSPEDIRRCAPLGVPRIWTAPFPFEIIQKPGITSIVYEHNRMFRLIYMDQPLPPPDDTNADPGYMGHSVGHWEDDTLVVQTAFFNTATVLDDSGLPHSDQLRVTERIRKIHEGKKLEVIATIEDPAFYSANWSTRFSFESKPDERIQEYICGYKQFSTRITRSKSN